MSVRTSRLDHDPVGMRQPHVRSKIWGFEPFWKFVSYDVELSSNSSTSSGGGRYQTDDDLIFGLEPEKIDNIYSLPRKMADSKPTTRIIPIQRVRTSSLTLPQQQQTKVMPVPEKDDKVSSFNRSYRKSSTLDRGRASNTFPRPLHRPSATATTSVPIQIPVNYQKIQAQRFDSLPARLGDRKHSAEPEVKLTSVLKKPGSVRDRRSLKKVAFLENSY